LIGWPAETRADGVPGEPALPDEHCQMGFSGLPRAGGVIFGISSIAHLTSVAFFYPPDISSA
jgi:hypothetical protein